MFHVTLLTTATSDDHRPSTAFKISEMSAQTLHQRGASSSSSIRPRQPTDAFRGLVAFFPKGAHSTAVYTWSASRCCVFDASEHLR